MMTFLFILHAVICTLLIGLILIQAGRGGGLVEGFSGVESMFGTKTNSFLTRVTTILAVMFFITCLSLAFLSARQGKSLLDRTVVPAKAATVKEPVKQEAAKAAEAPKVQEVPKETTKAQETPKTN
ncbi:MAG: preprotein translocase subunit SecG [Candidatus Omnitrophica bacterium]|jgi:preprotein translocase subunit SecG|nr:preprotein translocase subunit SecG [Candidatus Omnitrophota bacterium]